MFPIKAKRSLPIHQIVINSLSIRGRLGPITVWVTKDEEAYRDEERKRLAIEEAAAASSTAAAAATDRTSSPVAKKSRYHNLRTRFSGRTKPGSTSQEEPPPRAVRPIEGQISMRKRDWVQIYEREHGPSFREYATLDLSKNPIVLRPGEVRGVYIHSTLPGDEAIVYDNKHQRLTHDDPFLQILTGRSHVSEKPFGKMPIWGWGNAWRDAREFVGQVSYGAVYRLWNPAEHLSFGSRFQRLALTLFGCQRRLESPLCRLSDDIVFYILNMCKWDWARDDFEELAGEQKKLRKLRWRRALRWRREALLAATAAASVSSDTDVPANAKGGGEQCCAGGTLPTDDAEDDDRKPAAIVSPEVGSTSPRPTTFSDDDMRIDSDSDEEDGDDEVEDEDEDEDEEQSNEDEDEDEDDDDDDDEDEDEDEDEPNDDDSDEYDSDDYDDYRGMNPSVFHYRDYEEEDSDDEAAVNEEQRLRDAEARRRSWMRSQFARIHVLNALASMNDGGGGGQADMDVDSDGATGGGGGGHYAEEDDDSDY
eukprot:CAMPEP_0181055206 /NCGR_PEP_ID=MMETSP1070-20121207/19082_1 /TAXON_ID=265543 /ORGANISM="Minutocellus polymorphus, Strain NH13" /LENGTH=534 /DNA_ID=CAMNT_0023134515 /DNA_START=534 /DNA_END=2135 /DNA_ORIENTATION=+